MCYFKVTFFGVVFVASPRPAGGGAVDEVPAPVTGLASPRRNMTLLRVTTAENSRSGNSLNTTAAAAAAASISIIISIVIYTSSASIFRTAKLNTGRFKQNIQTDHLSDRKMHAKFALLETDNKSLAVRYLL